MRRSKAPSVLKKAQQIAENFSDPENLYDWGSRNLQYKKFNKNKRTFNIVWRDASTRKHKIWKGDGSLEVDNLHMKAILKDESGKYIGSSTKININELVPDAQMIISGKEVEIQNEIEDGDELQSLRRMQAKNFTNEDWPFANDKSDREKKPKGGFKFKPVLVLKSPKVTAGEKTIRKSEFKFEEKLSETQNKYQFLTHNGDAINHNLDSPLKPVLSNEFLCFLKPSELQQFLFQKVLEYLVSKQSDNIESLDVHLALKSICNHPSLINRKTTTNELLRHLMPVLPDWTETGPFDSGKLEFVQYFLNYLTNFNPQSCIIIAKTPNVLNMLQGLCDFMKIKCLRLNSNSFHDLESQVLHFCSTEDGSTYVILINSLEILSRLKLSTFCKKIIVFEEYLKFSNVCSVENFNDLNIYYLVTAFSVEELFLLDTCKNIGNLRNDLAHIINKEHDCCYLHSKIGCNCFESVDKTLKAENVFIKYWNHFKPPFDLQLLKVSSLESSSENIVSIFCKKK